MNSKELAKQKIFQRILGINQEIQELPKGHHKKESLSSEWVMLHWKLDELDGGPTAAESFYKSVC